MYEIYFEIDIDPFSPPDPLSPPMTVRHFIMVIVMPINLDHFIDINQTFIKFYCSFLWDKI